MGSFLFWLYLQTFLKLSYFALFLPFFLGYMVLDLSMPFPRKQRIYLHFFIVICYIAAIKILFSLDPSFQGKIGWSTLCLNPLTEKYELCPGSALLVMQNDPWSIIPIQTLFWKTGLPYNPAFIHPQTVLLLLLIPYFLGMYLSLRVEQRKRSRFCEETKSDLNDVDDRLR